MNGIDLHAFERTLREQLAEPLPGVQAQMDLSPELRRGWKPGHVPADARPGAGLLLIYPRQGALHTVITLRNQALQKHAGQLSLPGGAVEPGESYAQAAVREAHEEIGLQPDLSTVVGTLSPLYIPVSGFALYPIVAVARETPQFRIDPNEVARLLEVPLVALQDPENRAEESREYEGSRYRVPYIAIAGEKLWGATAMVYAELLAVLAAVDRAS